MADMDIAQRWDIAEVIVYMLMKHLGLNVDSPVKNSDDRWVDFWADYWEYQLKVQVKSAKDTVATVNADEIIIFCTTIQYEQINIERAY